jgi:hypothetical protein
MPMHPLLPLLEVALSGVEPMTEWTALPKKVHRSVFMLESSFESLLSMTSTFRIVESEIS